MDKHHRVKNETKVPSLSRVFWAAGVLGRVPAVEWSDWIAGGLTFLETSQENLSINVFRFVSIEQKLLEINRLLKNTKEKHEMS